MTRKWLTEADEYVCTLSSETREIARKELREDDSTRAQALDSLRGWIVKNPRIENCRLDSKFLLRFLRFTKFHVTLAEEVLERYLLLRQAYSIAFHNLDMKNPRMEMLLDKGIVLISPRKDKLGRRLVIVRAGQFDPYKFNNEDACRLAAIVHETLMEDEESQVRGYIYFCDADGVGLPYLTLFTPKEAVRIVKNGEKTIPMRHKEAHGYNIPFYLKFAVDFGFSLISDKYKKRIKIHTTMEEVHECIDKTLLPEEYGGDIPIAEMIKLTKEELLRHRDVILSHDEMKVKLECYSEKAREGAVSALKQGMFCKMDTMPFDSGLCGTFRKLEVD
ncbi:UNVERIFIED_CONTAM: hypothetical protein PYX00_009109 [Menopon gallinae]|uniref:CRAL-TRIO domain-containing protein n=1 Tax=Menopon gallinae TaxID=328185 RepID=A0AAW2HAC5_9NEOP